MINKWMEDLIREQEIKQSYNEKIIKLKRKIAQEIIFNGKDISDSDYWIVYETILGDGKKYKCEISIDISKYNEELEGNYKWEGIA